MKAADVTKGVWTTTWMRWAVDLLGDDAQWAVVVRSNPDSVQWGMADLIAAGEGFKSTTDAVRWACQKLREEGAGVVVLGAPTLSLEELLDFQPMGTAQA